MAKIPGGDWFRKVVNLTVRLGGRFTAGFPLFNAVRSSMSYLSLQQLSQGYQKGREILGAIADFQGWNADTPFPLNRTPVVPWISISDPIDNRILYRFEVRLRNEGQRSWKTLTIDVTSLTRLTPDEALQLALNKASVAMQDSPSLRRRGGALQIGEIEGELKWIGRRY